MYVYIWVSVCVLFCVGIPRIVLTVSVSCSCGYPKVCSDHITLACADSVYLQILFMHSCIYASVFMLCLIPRAWLSAFPQPEVCPALHHTSLTQKYSLTKFWPESYVWVCVCHQPSLYSILFRLWLRWPSESHWLSSQQRNLTPTLWVFVSHVYFHRRVASSPPSFHLLPSFIVCSEMSGVRWGDRYKKCMWHRQMEWLWLHVD